MTEHLFAAEEPVLGTRLDFLRLARFWANIYWALGPPIKVSGHPEAAHTLMSDTCSFGESGQPLSKSSRLNIQVLMMTT